MKGHQLYAMQQQARQLRALEEHQAEQSGLPLRKPRLIERLVLGIRHKRRVNKP